MASLCAAPGVLSAAEIRIKLRNSEFTKVEVEGNKRSGVGVIGCLSPPFHSTGRE